MNHYGFVYITLQATPVNSATGNAIIIDTNQLDPSSEAEALSHVASGIAASLGKQIFESKTIS